MVLMKTILKKDTEKKNIDADHQIQAMMEGLV